MDYRKLWLNEVAKHHKQWVTTVQGIGGDMYAEDIVQEMYLRLDKIVTKRGTHDFLFKKGKLQKGYVFFALRSILYSYLKAKNKHQKNPVEWLIHNLEKDKESNPIATDSLVDESYVYDEQGSQDKEEAYARFLDKVDEVTLDWEEYDRDVFNVYRATGMSFRTMSKYSEISYINLFYTVRNCKEKLKKELQEDYNDFTNGDYELI